MEEPGACTFCGGAGTPLYARMTDRLFGAAGIWGFMRCSGCGNLWLDPRPSPESLAKAYDNYYTHQAGPAGAAGCKARIKSALLRARYGYGGGGAGVMDNALGLMLWPFRYVREAVGGSVMWLPATPGGRLLDVGCGNGEYLETMSRLGWEAHGVDPDGRASASARRRLGEGAKVFTGTLGNVSLPEAAYDAVTSRHVIEHTPDPAGFFAEARRILRPGGRLVVTTPNSRSLGHRLFKEHWRGLEPPRHLNVLSRGILERCAREAGFGIAVSETLAFGAWGIWYTGRLIKEDRYMESGFPERMDRVLRLQGSVYQAFEGLALHFDRDAGETALLVAVKPDK